MYSPYLLPTPITCTPSYHLSPCAAPAPLTTTTVTDDVGTDRRRHPSPYLSWISLHHTYYASSRHGGMLSAFPFPFYKHVTALFCTATQFHISAFGIVACPHHAPWTFPVSHIVTVIFFCSPLGVQMAFLPDEAGRASATSTTIQLRCLSLVNTSRTCSWRIFTTCRACAPFYHCRSAPMLARTARALDSLLPFTTFPCRTSTHYARGIQMVTAVVIRIVMDTHLLWVYAVLITFAMDTHLCVAMFAPPVEALLFERYYPHHTPPVVGHY